MYKQAFTSVNDKEVACKCPRCGEMMGEFELRCHFCGYSSGSPLNTSLSPIEYHKKVETERAAMLKRIQEERDEKLKPKVCDICGDRPVVGVQSVHLYKVVTGSERWLGVTSYVKDKVEINLCAQCNASVRKCDDRSGYIFLGALIVGIVAGCIIANSQGGRWSSGHWVLVVVTTIGALLVGVFVAKILDIFTNGKFSGDSECRKSKKLQKRLSDGWCIGDQPFKGER